MPMGRRTAPQWYSKSSSAEFSFLVEDFNSSVTSTRPLDHGYRRIAAARASIEPIWAVGRPLGERSVRIGAVQNGRLSDNARKTALPYI
jgi:hypothetical protein